MSETLVPPTSCVMCGTFFRQKNILYLTRSPSCYLVAGLATHLIVEDICVSFASCYVQKSIWNQLSQVATEGLVRNFYYVGASTETWFASLCLGVLQGLQYLSLLDTWASWMTNNLRHERVSRMDMIKCTAPLLSMDTSPIQSQLARLFVCNMILLAHS